MAEKILLNRNELKVYSNKIRSSGDLLSTFFNDLEKEIELMSYALEGSSAKAYKEELNIINRNFTKKIKDILDKAADEMDLAVKRLLDADRDLARKLGAVRETRGIKPVNAGKLDIEAANVDLRTTFGTADLKVGLTQCVGDPVNAATGNFILEKSDLIIDGFNPLEFKRFYNAMDNWEGDLGRNWHHNYEIKLKRVSESIVEVTFEDGHVEYFIFREDGWYSTEPEKKNKLSINKNKEYILQRGNKVVLYFSEEGILSCLKNESKSLTKIYYNDLGKIDKIDNSCGVLYFQYIDNQITKVTDNTGRCLEYGYSDLNLSSVKSIDGYTYRYEYDDKHRLTRITNPLNNVTVTNIYDENGRTIEQTMADGTVNKFGYNDDEGSIVFTEGNGVEIIYKRDDRFRIYETIYVNGSEKLTFNDSNQITAFTDRNKNTFYYEYDLYGNMLRETNPLGYVTEYSYDDDNRLVSMKNPDGGVYSYCYDINGNVSVVKDPLERKLNIEYNDNGQPVKILIPDGSFYAIKYDGNGNPLEVTDPVGNTSRLEFDLLNRVKSVTKPKGNKMEFEYTSGGKIKKIIYPDGTFEKALYDQRGLVVEEINVNGHSVKNMYNSMGKLVERIDPLGGSTKYEYDSMWNIIKITKPDGSEIRYKYNSVNRLESITNEEGFTTSCEYDANGNIVKVVDARGYESKFDYDALNRLTKAVNSNNASTRYEYTWDGKVQKIINALNGITEFEYDLSGQLVESKDVLGNCTSYTYNSFGLLESITDPRGGVEKYEYNSSGNVTKIIHADCSETKLEYDKNYNITTVIDAAGNRTCFEYDSMDRVRKMINAHGDSRLIEYTKSGKVASIIDENGRKTQYEYDALERLIKVSDAKGGKTEYTYDAADNVTEIHQFMGITSETIDGMHPYKGLELSQKPFTNRMITSFKYDRRGLMTEEKNPAGLITVYAYDENGNLVSKVDREGFVSTFRYDPTNKLEKVIFHDGREVEYQYDLLGQVTGLTDWLGKTSFELDALGRIQKVKDYANRVTEYIWGVGQEKKLIKYPDGIIVSYEYDIMGRLCKMRGIQNGMTSYKYNSTGNIIEKVLPNNAKTKYEYDSLYRLVQMTNTDSQGNILENFRYKYDAIGNRTSIFTNRGLGSNVDGETIYSYDNLNQLVEVKNPDKTIEKYFYDSIGNRVRVENWSSSVLIGALDYKYDNQSRLTEIMGKGRSAIGHDTHMVMEYDKRGNLLNTIINGVTTGKYTFNTANQLATAENKEGNVISFIYDGLGRRVGLQSKDIRQHYVLDVTKPYHNVLMAYDKKLEPQSFTHGLDLTSVSSGDGTLYYMNDALGSPTSLLDNTGNIISQYGYDAFGAISVLHSPEANHNTVFNQIGYTGYQNDVLTGLQYAQARYYMPELGRFISEDSYRGMAVDPLSLNRFTYCRNNPLTHVDPNGHWFHVLVGALIGGVVNVGAKVVGDIISGEFDPQHLDWAGYAGAFASGLVIGGLTAATGGLSLVTGAAIDAAVTTVVETGVKSIITGENQFNVGTILKFGEGFVCNLAFGKLAEGLVNTKLAQKLVDNSFVERLMVKPFQSEADDLFSTMTRKQLYRYMKDLEYKNVLSGITRKLTKRELVNAFAEQMPRIFADAMINPSNYLLGNVLSKITISKEIGQLFGFNMDNDYYNDFVNNIWEKINDLFTQDEKLLPQCAS